MADRLVSINTAQPAGEQLPASVRAELVELAGDLTPQVAAAVDAAVPPAVQEAASGALAEAAADLNPTVVPGGTAGKIAIAFGPGSSTDEFNPYPAEVDSLVGASTVGKTVVKGTAAQGRAALQVDAAIAAYVDPLLASAGMVVIEHGDNAAAPRLNANGQTFTGRAVWVGSIPPNNRVAGDFYWHVETEAVPVLVWSDSASTPGALGNTETGGLAWQVAGGYTAAKSGGQIVITAAGTGVGPIYVTDGITNCRCVAKIAARGTQFEATIFLRHQDVSNHLVLCRTSSSVGTYIISKRVAGTQTTIATLTGFTMTNGDIIDFTTKSDGTLIVKINDVVAYSGNVPDFASAASRGVGVRATTNATTVAYDDLAVYTLVA